METLKPVKERPPVKLADLSEGMYVQVKGNGMCLITDTYQVKAKGGKLYIECNASNKMECHYLDGELDNDGTIPTLSVNPLAVALEVVIKDHPEYFEQPETYKAVGIEELLSGTLAHSDPATPLAVLRAIALADKDEKSDFNNLLYTSKFTADPFMALLISAALEFRCDAMLHMACAALDLDPNRWEEQIDERFPL